MSSAYSWGFAGGAGQGLEERRPGRQVPAGREDPPGDSGAVAYLCELGELLVFGLVQHPLLECIQPFVQLQGKRGELRVERADQRVQGPDRMAREAGGVWRRHRRAAPALRTAPAACRAATRIGSHTGAKGGAYARSRAVISSTVIRFQSAVAAVSIRLADPS